jgi:hypothetical protein
VAAVTLLAAGAPALAAPAGSGTRPGQVRAVPKLTRAQLLEPGFGLARRSPHPGRNSILNGVYCPAAGNCWSVGQYEKNGAQIDQIQHWNGKKWAQATAPNPGGTSSGDVADLYGLRCVTASNCWAVGYYAKHDAELDQILHWNGKKWSASAAPTPAGTLSDDINELFGVTCASASACWATGEYGTFDSGTETILSQTLRWNGKSWSVASTPQPGGKSPGDISGLDTVRCSSASNCWSIGGYGVFNPPELEFSDQALHWNGKRWSSVSVPSPAGNGNGDISSLEGLTCTSAANCWAVGEAEEPGLIFNNALHWNGKKWSAATTPNPDGTGSNASNILIDVFCGQPGSCWAVGTFGAEDESPGSIRNEALHYNGKKWSTVTTPDPGGTASGHTNELEGVRCTSTSACWAVGNIQNGAGLNRNEILRWNGKKWATS